MGSDCAHRAVRPRDAGNVGAVCRAMKCMGCGTLAIVPGELLDPRRARTLAHYAADVLDRATMHGRFAMQLATRLFVAGTTRRRGRNRKYFTLFPEQLARGSLRSAPAPSPCSSATRRPVSPMTSSPLQCRRDDTRHAAFPVAEPFPRGAGDLLRDIRALRPGPISALFSHRRGCVDDLVGVITRFSFHIGFFHQVTPDQMGVFFKTYRRQAVGELKSEAGRRVRQRCGSCLEEQGACGPRRR